MDEDELEAELEDLQQEQLDEQMLKTGSVPVSDQIQRVPAVPAGDSKSCLTNPPPLAVVCKLLIRSCSQRQGTRRGRGRGRRGRGAAQASGRDGHVTPRCLNAEPRGHSQRMRTIWSRAEISSDGRWETCKGARWLWAGGNLGLVPSPGPWICFSDLALAYGGCILTRKV